MHSIILQLILSKSLYLIEDRDKRTIAVHDIEALYLVHFHSEIIDNYTNSNVHTENELNIIKHPLPKYVRDYANSNYFNSDGASNITPSNYTNNIIVNKATIECNICNNNKCKCFLCLSFNFCILLSINYGIINCLLSPYNIHPITSKNRESVTMRG